jgi:hypothetical protein
MTKEDKELLLKDLSARLPYGVKINVNGEEDTLLELGVDTGWVNASYDIDDVKPYLRPPSSMTEEERNEYKYLVAFSGNHNGSVNLTDWLNEKMFAYRTINGKDMFELGLALEAPEGMYKHFGDMDVVITSVEHKDKL